MSAALAFVASHNLAVVVKSSGHEFAGRSTAPNALLLWMHHYKGISLDENYVACPGDTPGPALTVHAGNNWGDVYTYLNSTQYEIVGGSARTVCAAGGYTLGGGHGWQSPQYGLAVDNVLSMTGVLASGEAGVASPCSAADLFWALRGGGTFAVVTSITCVKGRCTVV